MHSEKPDPPDISGKIPVGLRHSHPGRHNRGDLASAWAFKPNDGGWRCAAGPQGRFL